MRYSIRSYALVLASFLILQEAGLPLLYKVGQYVIQWKMAEKIRREHATERLVMSLTAYKTSKSGKKEINLAGELYDVQSVTMKGDSVELLVFRDRDEENVLSRIISCASKSTNSGEHFPNPLLQILKIQFTLDDVAKIQAIPTLQKTFFSLGFFNVQSFVTEIPFPPPRL